LKYQTSPSNQLLAMAKYSRSQALKRVARGVGACRIDLRQILPLCNVHGAHQMKVAADHGHRCIHSHAALGQ
jgi:hypothetical protein